MSTDNNEKLYPLHFFYNRYAMNKKGKVWEYNKNLAVGGRWLTPKGKGSHDKTYYLKKFDGALGYHYTHAELKEILEKQILTDIDLNTLVRTPLIPSDRVALSSDFKYIYYLTRNKEKVKSVDPAPTSSTQFVRLGDRSSRVYLEGKYLVNTGLNCQIKLKDLQELYQLHPKYKEIGWDKIKTLVPSEAYAK